MKILFFFNILISLIIICVLSSCNNNSDRISTDIVNNPITADGSSDTTNLPRFQFESKVHDFGKIIQGEKVTYSFKFKNVGKSDLVISGASGSCGCTVPSFPKNPIVPGGSGQIDVLFNSEGKQGIQNKTITVTANTQPNAEILKIKVEIVVP